MKAQGLDEWNSARPYRRVSRVRQACSGTNALQLVESLSALFFAGLEARREAAGGWAPTALLSEQQERRVLRLSPSRVSIQALSDKPRWARWQNAPSLCGFPLFPYSRSSKTAVRKGAPPPTAVPGWRPPETTAQGQSKCLRQSLPVQHEQAAPCLLGIRLEVDRRIRRAPAMRTLVDFDFRGQVGLGESVLQHVLFIGPLHIVI